MVAIAAAVLVTFIGGLYFITHHKKEESETLQGQKVTGNGLPVLRFCLPLLFPECTWDALESLMAYILRGQISSEDL